MNDLIADDHKIDILKKLIDESPESQSSNELKELGMGCSYKHTFLPNLYVREMFIPKDLIIISEVHRTEHPYFILSGDVSVSQSRSMCVFSVA